MRQHREYRERYNTRPALRLLRPLAAAHWSERPMSSRKLLQWTAVLFIVLLINTAYIAAFASPTIFYMGNVLLHLVLGVVLTVALLFLLRQFPACGRLFSRGRGSRSVSGGTRQHPRPSLGAGRAHRRGSDRPGGSDPFAMRQAPAFRTAFQFRSRCWSLFPLATALYRKAFPNPTATASATR